MGAVIEKVHEEFRKENLVGVNVFYSSKEQNVSENCKSQPNIITNLYEIIFVDDWLMIAKSIADLTLMMNIALRII